MQVQSMFSGQGKKSQTVGMAAFIGAAVLFALGFILMLASNSALMGYQLPLVLMTIAAIDMSFATALSAAEVPAAERTRLRTLSIVGAIVVVMAATLITAPAVGVFEIVLMLVALGGAPGMYTLGETVAAKLKSADKPAPQAAATSESPKAAATDRSESGSSDPAA